MVLRACEVLKHILELQGPLPFMVEVGVDRGEDPRPERPETISLKACCIFLSRKKSVQTAYFMAVGGLQVETQSLGRSSDRNRVDIYDQ